MNPISPAFPVRTTELHGYVDLNKASLYVIAASVGVEG